MIQGKRKAPAWTGGRLVIRTFAGGDIDVVVVEAVDETIFLGDAPAPISGEVVAEGFGLADSFVPVSFDVV